eukprot:2516496-Karenia_brevis.AAC.1
MMMMMMMMMLMMIQPFWLKSCRCPLWLVGILLLWVVGRGSWGVTGLCCRTYSCAWGLAQVTSVGVDAVGFSAQTFE